MKKKMLKLDPMFYCGMSCVKEITIQLNDKTMKITLTVPTLSQITTISDFVSEHCFQEDTYLPEYVDVLKISAILEVLGNINIPKKIIKVQEGNDELSQEILDIEAMYSLLVNTDIMTDIMDGPDVWTRSMNTLFSSIDDKITLRLHKIKNVNSLDTLIGKIGNTVDNLGTSFENVDLEGLAKDMAVLGKLEPKEAIESLVQKILEDKTRAEKEN